MDFRIEAGDAILKEHMEKASGNAKYTSPKIQNESINLCEETVRGETVALANNSVGFSILADETADISGTEQLAIGVRFFDEKNPLIREEFLGFTPLKKMDAETIAETIIDQCNKYGLISTSYVVKDMMAAPLWLAKKMECRYALEAIIR